MPIKTALLGVVPPVAIALAILLAAWRPWGKAAPVGKWGAIGSALALALAYAVTDTLLAGRLPWAPPIERYRFLSYAGFCAAGGVMVWPQRVDQRWRQHEVVALVVFAAVSWHQFVSNASVPVLLPLIGWSIKTLPVWVIGTLWVLISLAISSSIRSDAVRLGRCGVRFPLTWWVASIGASVVYAQSSNVLLAQLSGVMAAVLGVFVVVGAWRRNFEFVTGLAPVFAVLYVGLMLACSDTTVISAVLVLLAALAPTLAGSALVAKLKPWMTTVLCMLLAAALSVAAVWKSPNGFDFSPI